MFDFQTFTSFFVRSAPLVRSFSEVSGTSSLAMTLRNVNLLARTALCKVMLRHGSDKSHFHNYTTVYSVLFTKFKSSPLKIFELGLGSNNLDVPSNMGVSGVPGASLRGWREFFPNAHIYGADIDRGILFQESRIMTFHCDQLNQSAIGELWSTPELRDGADIIIEDGLHTFEGNTSFLERSLDHLRPDGIYVIEDIDKDDLDKWLSRIEAVYARKYPKFDFAITSLPTDAGLRDNNLLIIRRTDNRIPGGQ